MINVGSLLIDPNEDGDRDGGKSGGGVNGPIYVEQQGEDLSDSLSTPKLRI